MSRFITLFVVIIAVLCNFMAVICDFMIILRKTLVQFCFSVYNRIVLDLHYKKYNIRDCLFCGTHRLNMAPRAEMSSE